MKFMTSVCVGLCALTLICLFRVSGKLDEISRRLGAQPGQPVVVQSSTPSASAIATELRRQLAEEKAKEAAREIRLSGAPDFSFIGVGHRLSQGGVQNSTGQLIFAYTTLSRAGGSATNLAVQAAPSIEARLQHLHSDADSDRYQVQFKPMQQERTDGIQFLPDRWNFSISYMRKDGR